MRILLVIAVVFVFVVGCGGQNPPKSLSQSQASVVETPQAAPQAQYRDYSEIRDRIAREKMEAFARQEAEMARQRQIRQQLDAQRATHMQRLEQQNAEQYHRYQGAPSKNELAGVAQSMVLNKLFLKESVEWSGTPEVTSSYDPATGVYNSVIRGNGWGTRSDGLHHPFGYEAVITSQRYVHGSGHVEWKHNIVSFQMR